MFFVPAIGTLGLILIIFVVLILLGALGGGYYGRRGPGPYDGV